MANTTNVKTTNAAYIQQRMTSQQVMGKAQKPLCETSHHKLIIVAVGALIGFLLCMAYIAWIVTVNVFLNKPEVTNTSIDVTAHNTSTTAATTTQAFEHKQQHDAEMTPPSPVAVTSRRQLYVGVLALQPYLSTRAHACHDTWGQNMADDELEFYAEMTSQQDPQDTVKTVPLKGEWSLDEFVHEHTCIAKLFSIFERCSCYPQDWILIDYLLLRGPHEKVFVHIRSGVVWKRRRVHP